MARGGEDGEKGETFCANLPPKFFTYERPAGGMPVGAIEDEFNLPPEEDEEMVGKEEDQMQVDGGGCK